ncbi:Cap-specific mRNA (nucleoside-2'-O-)-methyltransferase 2 [Triplophysa tibetana]|uniref:Cap-specific mRNA (nucleoside-2'-O-)-methyltransferase 2 n=1 Tax=Triplophysa tibetana TaxID=1572043 RepID=A0A5A9PQ70_9TELE|nr:Cap-specific mRNA (nucleoside-2'-O-)-methyltransferase 2 [Triplophysa tibetana]
MNRGRGVRKRTAPENAPETFDEGILAEVHKHFSKVKAYVPPSGGEWTLPDPSVVLCESNVSHPRLQVLKQSLNEVKNLLSDKDLSIWHQHTCSTNRAGTVTAHLRSTVNAELCTQAWAKFYEILGSFQLLHENALKSCELNSIHLCEAPGAFISALNHFLKTNRLHCDWNWIANTLNPYYEANGRGCTITDDRLITHTLPWWFFGSDNTGDILLQKHLLELQRFVSNMSTVHLVTADGSFDCQGDPGEQESLVAPLQYCEAVCALLLLGIGGSFVLKMFTLFEHSSICLLYLLACCFRSVNVFKPGTSKSGNSEIYIVCLDYQAKESVRPLLSKLIRNYGPNLASTTALFPHHCIPKSFLSQHEEICTFFHALQVGTIQENLRLFSHMSVEQRRRLDQLRECAADFYSKRFNVQYLPRKSWVCRGGVARWVKPSERKQMGSFNQRKEMQLQGWKQRLAQGNHWGFIEGHHVGMEGCEIVLSGPMDECDLGIWFVLEGAALPKVCSSTFCDQELLDFLNEALEENLKLNKPNLMPTCGSCSIDSPVDILSEICSLPDVTSCLVLGSRSCIPHCTTDSQTFSFGFCTYDSICILLCSGQRDFQPFLLQSNLGCIGTHDQKRTVLLPLSSAVSPVGYGLVPCPHCQSLSLLFLVLPPPLLFLLTAGLNWGTFEESSIPLLAAVSQLIQTLSPDLYSINRIKMLLYFDEFTVVLKAAFAVFPHTFCTLILSQRDRLYTQLKQ